MPAANRQIQIPFAYSVYTISLIFRTETQESGICLPTGYAHSWLLEIVALEMHSQQVVMEQLARLRGATGRVVGTRREVMTMTRPTVQWSRSEQALRV